MGNTLIVGSTAALVLTLGLFVALERPAWVPLIGEEPKPILVFLVGSRHGVDLMKRAVDPRRVVAETPDAIALVEGRMVATVAEAVGPPLMAAGWSDRELEIITVPKSDRLQRQRDDGRDDDGVDGERMARLTELMNKPELSYGEAVFVMNAMNDGLL